MIIDNCCTVPATPFADCNDGDVRLVDGNSSLDGTLLVCIDKAWGTVCENRFSEDDARVACKSLGFPFNGNDYYFIEHLV